MPTYAQNLIEDFAEISGFQETDCILITGAGVDALENAPVVPDEEDEAEAFTPDTAEKIDWVLSKVADARSRAARIRENMELIAREHEREAEHLEWKFGAAIQAWLRAELEGHKKKSRRLPNGVLGYRQKPAAVHVTDPAAALCWAKANLPNAVTEALDRRALSTALLDTGEDVPFAVVQPAEEVFYLSGK